MDFLLELLLTALLALLFSFLIAKLVSMAADNTDAQNVSQNIAGDATKEDTQYRDMLQADRFQSDHRVQFLAKEEAQIVDQFVKIENSVKKDLVIEAESTELPPQEISEVVDDHLVEENVELSAEKDIIIEESNSEVKRLFDEKEIKIDSEDDDDDDDWEGIERSELENIFAEASKFMEDEDLGSAGSDVGMELYALHKIATEGPCREQPPMPLKVAARAKWNAWQRLGNMTPEVAMEQYVAIVSDKVPHWNEDKVVGDGKPEPVEVTTVEVVTSDQSISSFNHPNYTEHSKSADDISGAGKDDLNAGPILEDLGKE
ncbi:acyl-CoA-binding domain 3 [Euphorbia peplus]|nr:acyl-CoA-binding domain 3 [Euphorbia peplus]